MDTIVFVRMDGLAPSVSLTLMIVKVTRVRMEEYAWMERILTPVTVLMVTQDRIVMKTLTNVTQAMIVLIIPPAMTK